jgi:hypothetical protein
MGGGQSPYPSYAYQQQQQQLIPQLNQRLKEEQLAILQAQQRELRGILYVIIYYIIDMRVVYTSIYIYISICTYT